MPPNELPNDQIGGGGAATSAGIRFQQQLGALFSSWILADHRFDDSFRLGDATPEWIRFETEAPVDDLMVKTTNGGFVAVQAKTAATLSNDLHSPLGKTITQFVRHWFVARDGNGSMEWNRPLNPEVDRLVLAVGPKASVPIKEDLRTALLLVSHAGQGALNRQQRHAYEVFSNLIERAWESITKEPFDYQLILELAKLVTVFTFDGDRGASLAAGSVIKAFGLEVDTATAFAALSDISSLLMMGRSGGDQSTLRRLLADRGIALDARPGYRADIQTLKDHTKHTAAALTNYERIEVDRGAPLTVRRECQAAIEAAARKGPLLIIGEPGAGKSGVLNTLCRTLASAGADVLEISVDRYSVESLQGLSQELGLRHSLLDVLEAWDGPEPAYLVIDALDATRGGRGEGAFRSLIERVLELNGRWNVVASIRSFDLRMGQQFRALFKGEPPASAFSDRSFNNVRHIEVPPWSQAELDQLLQQSPALARCLNMASSRLRDLALVPFNTRLISELISGGAVNNFDNVSSQADLLNLYWDRRVDRHGMAAKISLKRVIQLMVEARSLRANSLEAASNDPDMIDTLCQEGVLVSTDNGQWVQFRHHLLFDYAAAQLILKQDDIATGAYRFKKGDALGLMLSPALGFVLRQIWEWDSARRPFWKALNILINDEDGDPIIRSAAGRLGAEFPTSAEDCLCLGELVISGEEKAKKTLTHVTGALLVRLEDETRVSFDPWVFLTERLSDVPRADAGALRFLLHNLAERVEDEALTLKLGRAARALLKDALAQPNPSTAELSAIEIVMDTYQTDAKASHALLERLFDRSRLSRFGFVEVPTVCRKIASIGDVDPKFVCDVYKFVFGYEVTEDHDTRIGDSQILNLTSSARQDYEAARWALGKYFPTFLKAHLREAIKAAVNAVEGYVAREHPLSDKTAEVCLDIHGQVFRLREDFSYVWAHDPDSEYEKDAEVLISSLRTYLRDLPENEAKTMLNILSDEVSLAVFWSRIFLCAVERDDSLVDQLWPIAATESFLVLPDTRKDAIDVVAAGIRRRSPEERKAFEKNALAFDFSDFQSPHDARQAFLERLFRAIGRDNLITEEARQINDAKEESEIVANERLLVIQSHWGPSEDLHWIEGLDREDPENAQLIETINAAKRILQLEANSEGGESASLEDSLVALEAIHALLEPSAPHAGLRRHAESIIGQGCATIVARRLLSTQQSLPTPPEETRFMALLDCAAQSESPELEYDTEAHFEQAASWGSPAARVEAAQAYWDLLAQRPDLHKTLITKAEVLLRDHHPAVRLNALVRLGNIWDTDQGNFWKLLTDHLTGELNLAIIEHVVNGLVSRLIHIDQQRSMEILLALLRREAPRSDRARRMRTATASKFTVLWVAYEVHEAKSILDVWIDAVSDFAEETKIILRTLRDAIISGAGAEPDRDKALRGRAQSLISDIVDVANAQLAISMSASWETQVSSARECAQIIDTAGNEMYFAVNPRGNDAKHDNVALGVFLRENADLLRRIGEYAPPHTTYHLLQLIECLVDVDAAAAFDLTVSILQSGRRSNYQNDPLGVDLLVRLIGVFLADHKDIFQDAARRADLVDCLEIFLEAGWPATRRLLYRLPELIQ